VVVVLLGAVVLLWSISPGERRREQVMERIRVGDEVARVEELLGPAQRCPVNGLAHLRTRFADEWPVAAVDVALQRLSRETAERWVYPVDARRPADCAGGEGNTEIGIGRDGRVLWYVTITGKTGLRLPDDYTPLDAGRAS
jgi:hypothetical protein